MPAPRRANTTPFPGWLDNDLGTAVYAVTEPTQHARYLARAVASFQDLGAPAEHDDALPVDRACDLVGGAREVRARAPGDDLLDAGLRVQLDAEVQVLDPGHENRKRTRIRSVKQWGSAKKKRQKSSSYKQISYRFVLHSLNRAT
jgi:hypothetical protein